MPPEEKFKSSNSVNYPSYKKRSVSISLNPKSFEENKEGSTKNKM